LGGGFFPCAVSQERSWVIGRRPPSPLAATGVLSLGLLLPFGAGAFNERVVALAKDLASDIPAKHVTLVRDGIPETIETRAVTVDDLLIERGIARAPEDALSEDPAAALSDGETVAYRAAVPVTLVVDGVARDVRTPAATVRDLLAAQDVATRAHDRIVPQATSALTSDTIVRVTHVSTWTERTRIAIRPAVKHVYDIALATGHSRVVSPGANGTKEIVYLVSQPDPSVPARRSKLAARVLRMPHPRVIADGIGEYASFAAIARQGLDGTEKLARAALTMIATAYTADCSGCSGYTASGKRAGHGIVAVDPHIIPLGTHLYIPGYGHALAGDTGGAIRGNRIDLGFNSNADAMSFGRRPIVVYVLKKTPE
jgi:3D (Asp-Asp-Asp) domain-containing protein